MHLQAGVDLPLVAKQVWHDGLGVRQLFAQRDSDWLTRSRGR